MSNTYMEIKAYNDIEKFKDKMNHISRKKNMPGQYQDDDFINEIEDNSHLLTTNKVKSNRTRSDISNEISRYKYKIGRTKKPETKARYELKIKELNLERELLIDNRTISKKTFLEFIFTLTDVKENLKRDIEYGRDLKNLILKYLKDKFQNANIVLSSLILDLGNPHIHICAIYPEESGVNLSNDLKKSYQTMQLDFNNYVRESELIKKYDIPLEQITIGGKKEYLPLSEYKALNEDNVINHYTMINNRLAKIQKTFNDMDDIFNNMDDIFNDFDQNYLTLNSNKVKVVKPDVDMTILVLENEIKRFENQKIASASGHLYTTIYTLKNRIKELKTMDKEINDFLY